MRHIIGALLFFVPTLAAAHPGHGEVDGFGAGLQHALTSLPHLVPPLLLALLLSQLGASRRARTLAVLGFAALAILTGGAHLAFDTAGAGFLSASAVLLGAASLLAGRAPRVGFVPAAVALAGVAVGALPLIGL